MKGDYLILTVLVVGSILLLHIGCQKEAEVPEGPKTVVTEHKPEIGPAETQRTEPSPPRNVPKIVFEKLAHNFGIVGPGTKNVCEFKFTNTGDSPLKVTNVRVSALCCMRYTLRKKEYAPGESGTLEVSYHASKRSGRVRYSVFVSSNDKTNPRVTLAVEARIVLKVVHKPKELKLLLRGKNAGCPEITLTSVDERPFAVKSFESPGNCITASFDSSRKATEFVLETKAHIERLKKNLSGHVKIGLTHPECDLVIIPFNVLPEFEITPRSIIVRNAEPQKPIERIVWVLSNYGEDFKVESASSKKGIIKVLNQQKHGNRYKFELEITPPAVDGKRSIFTDVFYVNIKGREKLRISCRGSYSRDKKSH
jgi:hypothetical protein